MRSISRIAIALLVAVSFQSCTYVMSNVTRFHRLPAKGDGKTFGVKAINHYGLEAKQYEEQVAEELVKYGWKRVDDDWDYMVGIRWEAQAPRTRLSSAPVYGLSGGGTTTHYGSVGGVPYSGTSHTPSTYGVVGSRPVTKTVFGRVFRMMILDGGETPALEGKVVSAGSKGNMSEVMPEMIQAFFIDFPGKSGESKMRQVRNR